VIRGIDFAGPASSDPMVPIVEPRLVRGDELVKGIGGPTLHDIFHDSPKKIPPMARIYFPSSEGRDFRGDIFCIFHIHIEFFAQRSPDCRKNDQPQEIVYK
jgi:hypothetical protein